MGMYRLSNPQKLIYEMEKYAGGAVAVICGSVLLREKRSANELTHAVHEIFRRNGVLRTRIVERDGQVGQETRSYQEFPVNTLCFDRKEDLIAYAEEYAKIPAALDGTLCEMQIFFLPEQCGILTKCHHIIGDAWTLTLIASQLCALLAGEELTAFPYSDYLESESAYVGSSRQAKDGSFFLEKFNITEGNKILLVTSGIYAPFQLLKFMPIALEKNIYVDCVGLNNKRPGSAFNKPANYCQEIKATINAIKMLTDLYWQ